LPNRTGEATMNATGMTVFAWVPQFLLPAALLAGALLVGALVIAYVSRWRRQTKGDRLMPDEQLAHFRLLYEQGAMSQEEFERIKTRLGGEIRRGLRPRVPHPEVPTTPEPPPPPSASDNGPSGPP
jgi:hypothetical protein